MKIFNKYITMMGLSATMLIAGCSEDWLDVNTNPNLAGEEQADPAFLLTSGIASIGGELTGGLSFGGATYARQLYGLGTSTYAITGATYQEDWEDLYSEGLKDLQAVAELGAEQDNLGYVGISQVLNAYTFNILVDFFGDVPYTEALQGEEIVSPVFDDDAAIYNAVLANLDEAIANLDAADANDDIVEGDLIYRGNYQNWIRAANTLKLKMLLNIGNVDAARATDGINAILADGRIIDTNAANMHLVFNNQQVPNNRHPFYNGQYDTSPDYLDNFFMLRLLRNGDPRIRYYFYRQARYSDLDFQTTPCSSRTDCATWEALEALNANYIGRDHGDPSGLPGDDNLVTVIGLYPWGGKFDDASYRTVNANSSNPLNRGAEGAGLLPFFNAAMTHFMLAEAAIRFPGVATPLSVQGHFEAGMNASFAQVRSFALASSEADRIRSNETARNFVWATAVSTYIAARVSDFNSASQAGQFNLVMIEKNIASWGNGVEPYTDFRRTGYPNDFPLSLAPQGPFPRRVLYPDSELGANPNAPGIIPQSEPVFWDVN